LATGNLLGRKLRMAMIGGGGNGFIGPIHRRAAALCGNIELVAGAFSSDAERSRQCGEHLCLAPERVYPTYEEMIMSEANRPESERIDFISIVTPNHLHYRAARLALESGFHVISDKPVTRTLEEARSLQAIVASTGRHFGLTHTYLGYPLVSQAQQMITRGEFGAIRRIVVEYLQGWLAHDEESSGNKQAAWRTDPELSGVSGCVADIGTHAHNLVEYVTGQRITEVCSELTSFVSGRELDDDGSALFRTSGGAKGVLTVSQVCAGAENGLRISVYGTDGGLEWHHEDPGSLTVRRPGQPVARYRAGAEVPSLDPEIRAAFITPSGHPEGFIEAFANLYKSFSEQLSSSILGQKAIRSIPACPGIDDGVRGMGFVTAMVASSDNGGLWTALETNKSGDLSVASDAQQNDTHMQGLETA
jgi:predicted dehydrogenase